MSGRKWYGVVIHHTGGKDGKDRHFSLEQIESDQMRRGYRCLAYHYLFVRDRATNRLHLKQGRPTKWQGCHGHPHYNRTCLGIGVVGNYSVDKLTDQDYRDILAGMTHVMDKHSIARKKLWGHGDFKQTECPGDNFPLKLLKADLVKFEVD